MVATRPVFNPICCASSADEDGGQPVDDGDEPDPMAGMNARQRKMYELKQKLRVGQKANQHAVIAERKREKVRQQLAACCVRVCKATSHVILAKADMVQHTWLQRRQPFRPVWSDTFSRIGVRLAGVCGSHITCHWCKHCQALQFGPASILAAVRDVSCA